MYGFLGVDQAPARCPRALFLYLQRICQCHRNPGVISRILVSIVQALLALILYNTSSCRLQSRDFVHLNSALSVSQRPLVCWSSCSPRTLGIGVGQASSSEDEPSAWPSGAAASAAADAAPCREPCPAAPIACSREGSVPIGAAACWTSSPASDSPGSAQSLKLGLRGFSAGWRRRARHVSHVIRRAIRSREPTDSTGWAARITTRKATLGGWAVASDGASECGIGSGDGGGGRGGGVGSGSAR